jgi:hypothetical protein
MVYVDYLREAFPADTGERHLPLVGDAWESRIAPTIAYGHSASHPIKSVWHIYRIPLLLWAASLRGISIDLAADGHADWAGWSGPGVLAAIIDRKWITAKRTICSRNRQRQFPPTQNGSG